MKRFFLTLLSAMMIFSSCGPSRHSIHVEMRHPSSSGMELSGKIISIVCLENSDTLSSSLSEGIADGFAYALEQDYSLEDGGIGVFRMKTDPGADYTVKDSLINLIIETGADVVFLIDTLKVGDFIVGNAESVASPISEDSSYVSVCRLPVSVSLYGFDAMNKEEKVLSFAGSTNAVYDVYSDGLQNIVTLENRARNNIQEAGWEIGQKMSASFISQWKHEQYSVTYFEGDKWYKALNYADQYYWKEAMDIWLGLMDSNDVLKRSCAAYNISLACYMLGDYDLALLWLDRSDADGKLPFSDAMRKRIVARM